VEVAAIQPRKPNQNALVEILYKSFCLEVLDNKLSNSNSDVQIAADDWLMDYKECRPYESLGDMPPAAFLPGCLNGRSLVSNCPLDREVYGSSKLTRT
jgi:putative transposase